jgi:predicted nucleic acid-binding protein
VCDASALVEYLLQTPFGLQVGTIIEAPDAEVHVPALCDVEVTAALRVVGDLEALQIYLDLPLRRHGHEPLLDRIVELSAGFSAYDATYVALCEGLDATLVTGDADLTSAAQRHLSLNVIGVTA